MRVSTSLLQLQGIQAILDRQSQVNRIQEQISAGKRILTPSDDPAGAVRGLDLRQAIDTTTQYQDNILFARQRLQLEDSTLDTATDALQRIRELAVQGNNDTLTPENRRMIAAEVRQRFDELLALGNTRDANGEYIFAGYSSNTQPFAVLAGGGVGYNGDSGQRFLQISPSRQVAIGDSGTEVFRAIPNGNGTFFTAANVANTGSGVIDAGTLVDPTAWDGDSYRVQFLAGGAYQVLDSGGALEASGTYEPGAAIAFNGVEVVITGAPQPADEFTVTPSTAQDLFATVEQLVAALETNTALPQDLAQFHTTMNQVFEGLSRAEENLVEVRATIGARLNAVDSQESTNEDFKLAMTETLSSLEDLDLSEAVSLLKQELVGLEAAQLTFARIQGLSLFNFIR
jgi:flagellar hook-associated protein 3 FlgL